MNLRRDSDSALNHLHSDILSVKRRASRNQKTSETTVPKKAGQKTLKGVHKPCPDKKEEGIMKFYKKIKAPAKIANWSYCSKKSMTAFSGMKFLETDQGSCI